MTQITPRPVDGTGTNAQQPDWGATHTELLRLAPNDLGPNGEMSGADRPNPRVISNALALQTSDTTISGGASDFLWIWGQFLDHDLSLTEADETEQANISVPLGDPFFDPFSTGLAVIPFTRVDQVDGTYVNEITAFIDASMIYGSTATTVDKMRIEGGKLLMTEDAQLALEDANFVTGDTRAAENVALSTMHTIFTREHNRLVDVLAAENPALSDDDLFETARAYVEGIVQAITFNEFLPLLLGEDAFVAYEGYDANVNPGISIEFSTAAYRLGHTLLSPDLQLVSESGDVQTPLALRDAFFRPTLLSEGETIESILRGAATQTAQALDNNIVEDVRSFLFGPPGMGGLDLAALNIQRGRDLGVATYNDLREAVGLKRVDDFTEITSDSTLAAQLSLLYRHPDEIDSWIGGLAEDPFGDGLVGETFSRVLIDQFSRVRNGDPFWSEGRAGLGEQERSTLWQTTLSDVILRNTDIEALQSNAFVAMERIVGTNSEDGLMGTSRPDFFFGDSGDDHLDGLGGLDNAGFTGDQASYTVLLSTETAQIQDRRAEGDGKDTIANIENLSFSDGDWDLSLFRNAAACSEEELRDLIEVYIAYLNRAPDAEGLAFYSSALVRETSLEAAAATFLNSIEYQFTYPPDLSNRDFAEAVYNNVLGRLPDPLGLDFWVNVLDAGLSSRDMFILEVLKGVKAPIPPGASQEFIDQKAADAAYLTKKTDIGAYYSVTKGMSNVDHATTVMELFDNGDPMDVQTSMAAIDTFYTEALDPSNGEFLVHITGVIDDPFIL